jgi:hypothetical protein
MQSHFQIFKVVISTEGKQIEKESADLLPFDICLLPFDFI